MSGVDMLFKRMGLNRDIALAGGVLAIIGMLILPMPGCCSTSGSPSRSRCP